MKKLMVACAVLAVGGCAGPQDELRLARLVDGRTEIVLPYPTSTAFAESSGFPTDTLISARAKEVCPNGYAMSYQGIRQRPEYADPEKVWIVHCELGQP